MIWILVTLLVLSAVGLCALSALIVTRAQRWKEETMKNWEEDL